MTKPKLTKVLVLVCMLTAFYACTTKNEVPTPVVDTARVDALRTQLMALQQLVLGAQQTTTTDSLSLAQVQAEIASLQKQLSKTVSYTVTVGSFLFQPLKGATVSLTQGGKIVTQNTSSQGTATFNGLYAGIITATVDLPSFARLVYRADIRNTFDDANQYSTGSTVLMLPTGGTSQADSCMTTAYFKLYANFSMVNDTLGGQAFWGTSVLNQTTTPAATVGPDINNATINYNAVTDQTMTATLTGNSFEDQNAGNIPIPAGFTQGSGDGGVLSVAYENAKWPATVNTSTGVYTLKLPATDVSQNGSSWSEFPSTENIIDFTLLFSEFTHDFTQYNDGSGPYIQKGPAGSDKRPTFAQTYIYRLNIGDWLSSQTTTATQATPWPYFYTSSVK